MRLHFDGYPECYDFWANADSWDLKPAGWCEKNGHKLLLPKGGLEPTCAAHTCQQSKANVLTRVCFSGCKDGEFNWSMYVKNCRGQLAPKHLFKSLNTVCRPTPGLDNCQCMLVRPVSVCMCTCAHWYAFVYLLPSLWLRLDSELGWNWRQWTKRTRRWSAWPPSPPWWTIDFSFILTTGTTPMTTGNYWVTNWIPKE